MNFKYFHNAASKILYKHPDQPEILERSHRGKIIGWRLQTHIEIIRADNWLKENGQWFHATSDAPFEEIDSSRYSINLAKLFFWQRHSPTRLGAVEISKDEFDKLDAEYNKAPSKQNRLKG